MDQLFLLKPGFLDANIDDKGKRYYCPSCAAIEGVLSYYPVLHEKLKITYVDFQRPRHPIVELIGEANQGCPVLILSINNAADINFIKESNGYRFISSSENIMKYFAANYDTGAPHP